MSDQDVTILHEAAVRDVIQDEIETSVGRNRANIAAVQDAHELNAVFDNTEVEAALDSLGGAINQIITVLIQNGIIDPIEEA